MTLRMILALATAALLSVGVNAQNKVVYGEDNRLDLFEVTDSLHYELARSTAAMVSGSDLETSGTDVIITSRTLEQRGICSDAKFADQITAANCSGFLVAEDILVTAGHCIKSKSDCNSWKWVFGFGVDTPNKANHTVEKSDVYSCIEIISRDLNRRTQDDFAVIRLDRKVTNRTPLNIRTSGKVETGAPLVVIGHPTGLPTKVADGAYVRKNNNDVFFVTNLDTFGGNSGSAVFNSETGVVEGILVRGESDYTYERRNGSSCRVPKKCSMEGCRGEDVTRITNIPALLDLVSNK